MILCSLPMPPSLNNLFANKKSGGRFKTPEYVEWINAAGWILNSHRLPTIKGRYRIHIVVPDETKADLDNLVKPIQDLLQRHGIIENDKLSQRVIIERGETMRPGEASISLEAAA